MFPLRILLVVVLLAEGMWLAWRTPWKAETIYNEMSLNAKVGDAPFFRTPPRPDLKVFSSRISPFIDPKTVDIELSVDRVALFGRFAAMVVGTFFVYGIFGWFLTRAPRPPDVAYSLSVTAGYLVGSIASALTARFMENSTPLPWLNLFWAAGVGAAFVVTFLSRRRLGDMA